MVASSVHNESTKVRKFLRLFQIDRISNWSRFADKCKHLPPWFLLFSSSFPKSACSTQAIRPLWCFLRFSKLFPTWKLGVALGNVPRWQNFTARQTNSSRNLPSATHAYFTIPDIFQCRHFVNIFLGNYHRNKNVFKLSLSQVSVLSLASLRITFKDRNDLKKGKKLFNDRWHFVRAFKEFNFTSQQNDRGTD